MLIEDRVKYEVLDNENISYMNYQEVERFLSRRKYYNYSMVMNIDEMLLEHLINKTIINIDSRNIDYKVLLNVINESNVHRLSNKEINTDYIEHIPFNILSKIKYSEEINEVIQNRNIVLEFTDIMQYPSLVAYVRCEKIILEVLDLKPECCKHIRYFTDSICEKIIDKNPSILRYLTGDLNDKYSKRAVSVDGNLLQYVEKQTEEIVEIAVLRHYKAIRFVKDRHLADRLNSIYANNEIIIKENNRRVDRQVLYNCYEGYKYITELTPNIFMDVLRSKDSNAIEFIKQKFYKEIINICESNPTQLVSCL